VKENRRRLGKKEVKTEEEDLMQGQDGVCASSGGIPRGHDGGQDEKETELGCPKSVMKWEGGAR
jgi:hypothetical protein